jgi:hypothetical protein
MADEQPAVSPNAPLLVIGGGLAGLTAALHLAERGLPVTVLEADPAFAGGRLSGKPPVTVGDWTFPIEHGVHGIWSPYLNFQAMLGRHRIRPMFVPAQEEDWFYRNGKLLKKAAIGSAIRQSWIPAPFHYLNLFLRPSFLASITIHDFISLLGVWTGLMFAIGVDPLVEHQPLTGMLMSDVTVHWPGTKRLLGHPLRDSPVRFPGLFTLLHRAAPRFVGLLVPAWRWRHQHNQPDGGAAHRAGRHPAPGRTRHLPGA